MQLLISVLIVLVILALVLWAIYYLPFPPGLPAWSKNFLYVIVLLIAVVVLIYHTGALHLQ